VQSLESKITLIAKEKNLPDHKPSKNQVTLLLGGNDTGNPHHPYDTDLIAYEPESELLFQVVLWSHFLNAWKPMMVKTGPLSGNSVKTSISIMSEIDTTAFL
jgi:hypothetical protein